MSTHSNRSGQEKYRLYLMDEFRLVSGEVSLAASGSQYDYVPWDLQQEKAAMNSARSIPGAQKQNM